jgi:hypothetical protein
MHDPAVASLKDACACCARAFAYIKRVDLTRIGVKRFKIWETEKQKKESRILRKKKKIFFLILKRKMQMSHG